MATRWGELRTYRADEVPDELLPVVCVCPEASVPHKLRGEVIVCKKCSKVPRYRVANCRQCGLAFVKDFEHPNFSFSHPLCWEHCQEPTEEHDRALDKWRALGMRDKLVYPPRFRRRLEAYQNVDLTKTVFAFKGTS
jgi:hypothetical protein